MRSTGNPKGLPFSLSTSEEGPTNEGLNHSLVKERLLHKGDGGAGGIRTHDIHGFNAAPRAVFPTILAFG